METPFLYLKHLDKNFKQLNEVTGYKVVKRIYKVSDKFLF